MESVVVGSKNEVADVALHHLFERNARNPKHAEKTALLYEDEGTKTTSAWSYAALDAKSDRVARVIFRFCKQAVANQDGDRVVCVKMEPSERLLTILLSIWKIGAAYLPLDSTAPPQRIKHIIGEVRPVLIISDDQDLYDGVAVVRSNVLFGECGSAHDGTLGDFEIFPQLRPGGAGDSIAIVLYTSGSTGVPKGVRLPHKVILNRLAWQWRTFPYTLEEDVCVFKTSLTFVDSVCEIWGPLLNGDQPKSLLVVPKGATKDAEKLVAILDAYKGPKYLENLKLWICSGETLSANLARKFWDYFPDGGHKLCNFYGSTEIMGDVSYCVVDFAANYGDKIPIGIPVDNTILYALNEDLNPVPRGEIGELFVAGKNLAAGYVNGRDPEKFISNPLSSETNFDVLFRTGDYVKVSGRGELLYEGRTDSQIKIRGQRVDLAEVQAALAEASAVEKSAVICYKPGHMNQTILAFVTLNGPKNAKEIEKELSLTLVPYAVPRIVITENIPLLVNGKVDRQTLLKQYEENEKNPGDLVDFSGVEEKQKGMAQCLFATVAEVLGPGARESISARANFYELGGNSLNCVFAVTKLRERGYFIDIGNFLAAPNLGEILRIMQRESEESKENIPAGLVVAFKSSFRVEMLSERSKHRVYDIIADSFYYKADLERWLDPIPKRNCYIQLLDAIWEPLVAKNLSFAVYDVEIKDYVAAALNFDIHDEPEVHLDSQLNVVFDFLEFLEAPIRENKLPHGKKQVLHSFMLGTAKELSPAENVKIVAYMEQEILKLARQRAFLGIFTTNTNPLTQQLGRDVFQYRVMLDYQVNQYRAPDGSYPFKNAPDHQTAACSWKPI